MYIQLDELRADVLGLIPFSYAGGYFAKSFVYNIKPLYYAEYHISCFGGCSCINDDLFYKRLNSISGIREASDFTNMTFCT